MDIATWRLFSFGIDYICVRKRAREKRPGDEVVRKRPALRQIVWECQSQTWVWQACSYYIFLYFLAIDWIRKTSTMGRKKRNSEDPLDTNRRQSQTRAGQDGQARVDERPISANPLFHFLYLPSNALLRVTCCVIISFFQGKGTTVFCKLELSYKKTLLKIWLNVLNPGLNLTIFRETGPRLELHHSLEQG